MIINVAVLGFIFLNLSILGLAGWVNTYDSDKKYLPKFFNLVMYISLTGLSLCYITVIVLLITGG